jgi:hypothetical protein
LLYVGAHHVDLEPGRGTATPSYSTLAFIGCHPARYAALPKTTRNAINLSLQASDRPY